MEGPEVSLRRKLLLGCVPLREREEVGSPVLEESQTGFSSYYRNELALQRGRGIAGVTQEQEAHRKERVPSSSTPFPVS